MVLNYGPQGIKLIKPKTLVVDLQKIMNIFQKDIDYIK